MTSPRRPSGSGGFTLVELLVVLSIVVLVSAATLPVLLPALERRQVSEAARIFQAGLAAARDSAIRANSPRGIRLLPDPVLFPQLSAAAAATSGYYRLNTTDRFASSSFVGIEPGPSYSEGLLQFVPGVEGFIQVQEVKSTLAGVPNPPASWYWNIRVGERLRLEGSGASYIIRGPQQIPTGPRNPEGFVNNGAAGTATMGLTAPAQFLILTNGLDDDGDGFADEGFDGIRNYASSAQDPGLPGLIDNNLDGFLDNPSLVYAPGTDANNADANGGEFELEPPHGTPNFPTAGPPANQAAYAYTIERRPVPVAGARVTTFPGDAVIDLTTWNFPEILNVPAERSRLPVDPQTGFVDILLTPSGQVVPSETGRTLFGQSTIPFYHFWLAERDDIYPPEARTSATTPGNTYYLPMPEGTPNLQVGDTRFLQGERRLVTLHTRTGLIVTNPIEQFDARSVNYPYTDAQKGEREAR